MIRLSEQSDWLWEIGLASSQFTEASTEKDSEGGESYRCLEVGSIPHLSMFHRAIVTGIIGKYITEIVIAPDVNQITLVPKLTEDNVLDLSEVDRLLLEQISPPDAEENIIEGLKGLITTDSSIKVREKTDTCVKIFELNGLSLEDVLPEEGDEYFICAGSWTFSYKTLEEKTFESETQLDEFSDFIYLLNEEAEGTPFDSLRFANKICNASEVERKAIITNYAIQALGSQKPVNKRKSVKQVNNVKRKAKRKAQRKARRKAR